MPPPKFKVAITPKPFVGLPPSSPEQYVVLNLGASYIRAGSRKTFNDALKEINNHLIECLGKDACKPLQPALWSVPVARLEFRCADDECVYKLHTIM
jgi:hypothetical protein